MLLSQAVSLFFCHFLFLSLGSGPIHLFTPHSAAAFTKRLSGSVGTLESNEGSTEEPSFPAPEPQSGLSHWWSLECAGVDFD